jgi:hypothetical protein
MADQIVLVLPDDIAARARLIAETTSRPVEEVLIDYLKTLSAPLPVLPPDEQAEIDALHHLSDDALWTIAREQMPDDVQARAHELLDKNSMDTISDQEQTELERLIDRGDRLMLRKAEAAAILRDRSSS